MACRGTPEPIVAAEASNNADRMFCNRTPCASRLMTIAHCAIITCIFIVGLRLHSSRAIASYHERFAAPPQLADQSAQPTKSQQRRLMKPRSIFLTHCFQKDTFPVHLMVQHQRRMLTNSPKLLETTVLDNRPPWMAAEENLQAKGMKTIRRTKGINVIDANYTGIDDPQYLSPIFTLDEATRTSQRGVKGLQSLTYDEQQLTNFVAMLALLRHCLDAPGNVEVCVLLDHDIFVFRRALGIIDLAPSVFEHNPKAVVLMPPWGCHHKELEQGDCGFRKDHRASTRYMVVHRDRLKKMLPLPLTLAMWGRPFFESVFTNAVEHHQTSTGAQWPGFFGQMQCGNETFAVHPATHFSFKGTMMFAEVLKQLAASHGFSGKGGSDSEEEIGLREFIKRMEAGKFIANDHTIKTVIGSCEDMVPDAGRIQNGHAWL